MAKNADPGRAKFCQGAPLHHGDDAGLLTRLCQIHLGDLGVGVWAAIKRHMGQARNTHIVQVGTTALQ